MQPPGDQDPYRAVWQMSQVGNEGGHGRRIRWLAGILSGLLALMPFALVTSAVWGWWDGESNPNGVGWAFLLIGIAAGFALGGYIATSDN